MIIINNNMLPKTYIHYKYSNIICYWMLIYILLIISVINNIIYNNMFAYKFDLGFIGLGFTWLKFEKKWWKSKFCVNCWV